MEKEKNNFFLEKIYKYFSEICEIRESRASICEVVVSWPEIKDKSEFISLETYKVSAKSTVKQEDELKENFGIVLSEEMFSVCYNELLLSLNKNLISVIESIARYNTLKLSFLDKIIKKIHDIFSNSEYIKFRKIKKVKDLEELIISMSAEIIFRKNIIFARPVNVFMLCSARIGSVLMDSKYFESIRLNDTEHISAGLMHKLGIFSYKKLKVNIFVDPYMKWDSNYFYLGESGSSSAGIFLMILNGSLDFQKKESILDEITYDLNIRATFKAIGYDIESGYKKLYIKFSKNLI